MVNKKKAVPLIRKRFEYALKRYGYSKNKFSKMMFPGVVQPARKLQKYLVSQEIAPELLDDFAHALDISPEYLNGTYNVTIEDLVKDYGEDFYSIFSPVNFDSDGYHFWSYEHYKAEKNQMSANEHLIAFLNEQSFMLHNTKEGSTIGFCDFHKLDRNEFAGIKASIVYNIQQEFIKPSNKAWKDFRDSTPGTFYPNTSIEEALKLLSENEDDE